MAAALIEVDVDVGGARRTIRVQRPTLGDLEDIEIAQASNKLGDILPVMGRVLGLSREELRGMYPEDLKAIMEAVARVNNVPLGSV